MLDLNFFYVFLPGIIRLLCYLSENRLLGKERAVKLVVDAGTGTTAVGLGLGIICLGWVFLLSCHFL